MTSTSLVEQKPKHPGGRPLGTPNAATRKRQMEALRGGEAPKSVMLRTMRRYYRKAEKFENALEGDLTAWLTANRDRVSVEEIIREVVRRSKTVDELYDKAVKIAAQLAPYYHPTLAAIHHTGEVEVQNIVRVPDTAESVEQWLKGTPGELIEVQATEVKP